MPAGLPYFAWIDAGETTFTSGHMRWDEAVFSFTLKQDEGDPASLTAVVRRPRNSSGNAIGLLGPGRKIWVWFALDCGPDLIKFRGRLVGIPTSVFEELVTLEFVAKPVDLVAQKEALAASLRVLPFYDEAVIDPQQRNDPDVVLEGYTKIWAYDRETHVISVSDEISGEDGLVEFDDGTEDGAVLYDGLGLTLTSGPLARVDVSAEYSWTQRARGALDLTAYLTGSWPGSQNGNISLNAGDWPKHGAGLGDGWEVVDANAIDFFDFKVTSKTTGSVSIVKYADGSGHRTSFSQTTSSVVGPQSAIFGKDPDDPPDKDEYTISYGRDGDNHLYVSGYNRSVSKTTKKMVYQWIRPTLTAGYTAARPCTERVSFSLFADVQPILTDPEDGEALRIDNIRSVNLSDEGLIGDPSRRSYIATERGNRSLEHLIALARAHLMKRARVVEISFAPKLARMAEITLRKNAFLVEPRVGEALGKIVGYSIALDGADGRIKCEVRMGCAIGRGGLATQTTGTPTYCSATYVGFDYQRYSERTVLIGGFANSSVGYQPPYADPNDDGINFGSASVANMIDVPISFHMGPDEDGSRASTWSGALQEQFQIEAKFKLKSMTREFSTDYELQVTDLKIPTGVDLEAT